MPRAQIHLVNNHLTTALLERLPEGQRALLERLCTDSIYTLSDDFDRGLNADAWYTENMALADHDHVLYSTSPEEAPNRAGGGALLRSRVANFFPNRRAVVQARVVLSQDGSHLECGFVKEDATPPAAILNAATTLRRGAESFGLAIRSPAVSGWYVASGGTSGTSQTAVTTRVAERGWVTLLVAVNEQGETRLWLNGQNDNTVARRTDMHVGQRHYVWLGGLIGNIAIDYIQSWQERVPL